MSESKYIYIYNDFFFDIFLQIAISLNGHGIQLSCALIFFRFIKNYPIKIFNL